MGVKNPPMRADFYGPVPYDIILPEPCGFDAVPGAG